MKSTKAPRVRNSCATLQSEKPRSKVRQRQRCTCSHSIRALSVRSLAMQREVHLLREREKKIAVFGYGEDSQRCKKASLHLVFVISAHYAHKIFSAVQMCSAFMHVFSWLERIAKKVPQFLSFFKVPLFFLNFMHCAFPLGETYAER